MTKAERTEMLAKWEGFQERQAEREQKRQKFSAYLRKYLRLRRRQAKRRKVAA